MCTSMQIHTPDQCWVWTTGSGCFCVRSSCSMENCFWTVWTRTAEWATTNSTPIISGPLCWSCSSETHSYSTCSLPYLEPSTAKWVTRHPPGKHRHFFQKLICSKTSQNFSLAPTHTQNTRILPNFNSNCFSNR